MIKTEIGCTWIMFSAGIDFKHWPEWVKKPGKLFFYKVSKLAIETQNKV